MLRTLLIAGCALALIIPATAAAQDEKLGTLGRAYISQGMAVGSCTTTNDCTVKMARTVTTAGRLADRATVLLRQGDVPCVKPAVRFRATYLRLMQPAVKAWMANPGFAAKQRFTSALIKVASTLPDLYHKC